MRPGDATRVRHAFEDASLRIPLESILPLRQLSSAALRSVKYAQIAASIEEVGIIEPPVVVRDASDHEIFHLLDGHVRVDVLKKRGDKEVVCLVATDDEAFTYNKRVSRIATIQEHKMILTALDRGVPEARLASALHLSISSIKQKKRLLDGICPEAAELLKDKHVPHNAMTELKKLKAVKQVEVAHWMTAMNKYTTSYVRSLVATTPETQLVAGRKKPPVGLSDEQVEAMENEAARLNSEFRAIEQTYGSDNLDLVLAIGYVAKLLKNARTVGYLAQRYPDILSEFQKLAERQKAA